MCMSKNFVKSMARIKINWWQVAVDVLRLIAAAIAGAAGGAAL